jgi:hypothetical protein
MTAFLIAREGAITTAQSMGPCLGPHNVTVQVSDGCLFAFTTYTFIVWTPTTIMTTTAAPTTVSQHKHDVFASIKMRRWIIFLFLEQITLFDRLAVLAGCKEHSARQQLWTGQNFKLCSEIILSIQGNGRHLCG